MIFISWGYGKNYDLLNYNKFNNVFENDKMKVYKANIIYMGNLEIKIIHNKVNNNKRVLLKYNNKQGKCYDFENKTLKEVITIIKNNLLDSYYYSVY